MTKEIALIVDEKDTWAVVIKSGIQNHKLLGRVYITEDDLTLCPGGAAP